MSRDYIELGPTPAGEPCVQIGVDNYSVAARIECRRYKQLLEKMFPTCEFAVKGFPHDFGSYYEVVVYIDESNPHRAFNVEKNLPETWE